MTTLSAIPDNAFHFNREVSFSDTDAAGVAHFTALMRYVEDAEHKALQTLGITVLGNDAGWPRVHVEADFFSPLIFGDKVEITLWLKNIGKSSLEWNFHIHHGYSGVATANGSVTTVHTTIKGEKLLITNEQRANLSSLLVS